MKKSIQKTLITLLLISAMQHYGFTQLAVTTYVDSAGTAGYNGDGIPARQARFNATYGNIPGNITLDNAGNLYIADYANHRIRKVDAVTKIITTIVGNGVPGFSGDSGLASNAQLNYPVCVAFDAQHNMYITDASNVRIRRVDAVTNIITTYAGNGSLGDLGDGGLAVNSQFRSVSYMAFDGYNNCYVIDNYRVRKINPATGIISAFAGQISYGYGNGGDGGFATSAWFGGSIAGILADPAGIVYITDGARVRKVQGGIISTVIGHWWDNGQLYGGDGGLAVNAYYTHIYGMCWGIYGEMYICDWANHLIRKYNPTTGVITTVVGDIAGGYPFLYGGFNGDGLYPTATRLNHPTSVAVNTVGEMYIMDMDNNRVRKVYQSCSSISVSRSVTICSTSLPYLWAGMSLNSSGTYTVHQTLSSGCDSAATLNLSVLGALPPITGPNKVCIGGTIALSIGFSGGTWSSIAGCATVNNSGVVTGVSAGNATIRYSYNNELGCYSAVTYTVRVNPIPAVPRINYAAGSINPQTGPGGAFCNSRTFTLEGSPGGGTWSTSTPAVISINPSTGVSSTIGTGSGSVTYTYSVSGCSNSRTISGMVVNCPSSRGVNTSNNQFPVSNSFTIYPNPARTFIRLNIETLTGSGSIVVTDLYGKQVAQQALGMGTNTIDVSRFAKGMYWVSIITGQGKETRKILVE